MKRAWILATCLLAALATVQANSEAKRDPKFSLFSVVTFQNLDCKSQDGGRNGTCYTSTECGDKGGKQSGTCASGFGVCCLFVFTTSGSSITQNGSYIQSPNFPSTFTSTDATSLTYTINKCQDDVCALRLDLLTFSTQRDTVATAAENNACADAFTITTTSQGTSQQICGENAGQHIYYELGRESTATATLAFTISSVTLVAGNTRSFEIKVSQIPCAASYRPPSGCLQYHTGLTGTIKTFNYDATATATRAHLASQRYNICIRREAGMCCNQYSLCDYTEGATINTDAWSLDTSASAVINVDTGTLCSEDYVQIDGLQSNCNAGPGQQVTSNVCGILFGGTTHTIATNQAQSVCDCSAPFNIGIVTDAIAETPETDVTSIRGVCLDYQQVPC